MCAVLGCGGSILGVRSKEGGGAAVRIEVCWFRRGYGLGGRWRGGRRVGWTERRSLLSWRRQDLR